VIRSNLLIWKVSLGLSIACFLFYLFDYSEAARVSFGLVCVYLFITIHLDIFIKIAKALKWNKTGVIIVGFFGIKNVFFIFYFVWMYSANMVNTTLSILIIPILYFLYSFLIGKKLLELKDKDFTRLKP
tara:strand:+ start:875 stop:1261 length:387 start_codon:yes stop_codon:yes gene_type:complete